MENSWKPDPIFSPAPLQSKTKLGSLASHPELPQCTSWADRAELAGGGEEKGKREREKPSTTFTFWVSSFTFSPPGSPGACHLSPGPRPPWNFLFGGEGRDFSPHVLGTHTSAYTLAPTQIHKTFPHVHTDMHTASPVHSHTRTHTHKQFPLETKAFPVLPTRRKLCKIFPPRASGKIKS